MANAMRPEIFASIDFQSRVETARIVHSLGWLSQSDVNGKFPDRCQIVAKNGSSGSQCHRHKEVVSKAGNAISLGRITCRRCGTGSGDVPCYGRLDFSFVHRDLVSALYQNGKDSGVEGIGSEQWGIHLKLQDRNR